jgi:hypothetical protein
MWKAIEAFWGGLSPDIQAAVIGALATVGTATLGAMAVVWQIGRQARHAIQQNQHNEGLKLKLRVYEEIVAICRDASDAEIELSSYVRAFATDIALFRQMTRGGLAWPVPKARIAVLNEKKYALSRKTTAIISFTERWQIIDPRMEIVRIATNAATHDIDMAFPPYLDTASRIMPQEIPGHPKQGTLFPWHPPDDQTAQQLETVGKDFLDALMNLGSYIYDFQVEMQNLLLGELFKHKVPPRKPIDPDAIVVELERHKELAEYFDKKTAWGRYKAHIESEVRSGGLSTEEP